MTFDDYVGLPWRDRGRDRDGVDCWGLFRLVYGEMFRIDLPSYADDYVTAADRKALHDLIAGGKGDWVPVQAGQERPFDGIVMREAGVERHIGLVTRPGYLLHIEDGGTSVIESYRGMRINRRIAGFYRHVSRL